jgi:hypothetical protein
LHVEYTPHTTTITITTCTSPSSPPPKVHLYHFYRINRCIPSQLADAPTITPDFPALPLSHSSIHEGGKMELQPKRNADLSNL